MAVVPENNLTITVGTDRKFCIHDINIKECVYRSSLSQSLTAVDMSGNGVEMALGTEDGYMFIFDIRNLLRPIVAWKQHSSAVTNVLFDRNSRYGEKHFNDMTKLTLHFGGSPYEDTPLSQFERYDEEIGSKIREPRNPETSNENNNSSSPVVHKVLKSEAEEIQKVLHMKKQEIIEQILKDSEAVQKQMDMHMGNFEKFVEKELQKIEEENDNRWDYLVSAANNMQKDETEDYTTVDNLTIPASI